MIDDFLKKDNVLAIVGASKDISKYGHTLTTHFHNRGFKVVPVNLFERDIEGIDCFPTIEDYPEKIDVVIFVVKPEVVNQILPSVKKLKINKVWFQPGSESQEAINFCKENNIEYISNTCVLVEDYKKSSNENEQE